MTQKTLPLPLAGGTAALAILAALVGFDGSRATAQATEAPRFDLTAMSAEEEAAFGAAVRDYLLANPQVIMDAVAVLEQQEADARAGADTALVVAHRAALFDDGFSFVGGNPEGDLTIVEFMDYRCGYCRRARPEVEQLLELDGNIRLIVKEFPILGEASVLSSRFAVATMIVGGPEAYEPIHTALMTLEGEPTEAVLVSLAETLGLDAQAILAEMGSEEVSRRLAETRALAQSMQISGTPTFVFGNQMVRGYAPLDAMLEIVAQERDAQ